MPAEMVTQNERPYHQPQNIQRLCFIFTNSLALIYEPQLMHSPMDSRPRLQERPFQIGLMVLLSMVVRHGPRLISWAQLADVGETAVVNVSMYCAVSWSKSHQSPPQAT